jgi:hypothetical protein
MYTRNCLKSIFASSRLVHAKSGGTEHMPITLTPAFGMKFFETSARRMKKLLVSFPVHDRSGIDDDLPTDELL